MGRSDGRSVLVLLVEDNPGDVRLIREAFGAGPLDVELAVVMDGVEAWDYLQAEGKHEAAPRPDLVILDLNLPRRDGRTVLAAIKNDPDLRQIPVCVLTSSSAEDDILTAYDRHANSYVTKPMELDRFVQAIRQIEQFWLATATLPSVGAA